MLHFKMISIYMSYELIHACLRPPRTLAYFHLKKIHPSNFLSAVGWASVTIYSMSARVRNVICAVSVL